MKINVKITRQENATYYNKAVNSIVEVELEDYIASVVASEIGNSHIESCKAQAIAARTFAYPYYSKNNTITDTSTHQAFRIQRLANGKYPNAIAGTNATKGMILEYNGKPLATCSYCASNGGRTVSSKSRWGGERPYLIEQDDPWDAAVGKPRNGHGVGMSQEGAAYAARSGKSYKEILAFYYPGTDIVPLESESNSEVSNMIKASELVAKCRIPLEEKWGYIWGQKGDVWTEKKQKSSTRDMTVKYGSKWIGKRVTDCSGLLYWAFKELGGYMYHGSNTIWNKYTTNKGKITSGISIKPGTAVFLVKSGNRHHVGIFVGNDTCIEAKGTQYGVVTSKLSHWNEWGELKGVDYSEYGGEIVPESYPTLKKGAKGTSVTTMQNLLVNLGYTLEVDGVFGTDTRKKVMDFQKDNGLTVDGICGSATWNALKSKDENKNEEPKEDIQESMTKSELLAKIAELELEITRLRALL